jgi:hypothetical protein
VKNVQKGFTKTNRDIGMSCVLSVQVLTLQRLNLVQSPQKNVLVIVHHRPASMEPNVQTLRMILPVLVQNISEGNNVRLLLIAKLQTQ